MSYAFATKLGPNLVRSPATFICKRAGGFLPGQIFQAADFTRASGSSTHFRVGEPGSVFAHAVEPVAGIIEYGWFGIALETAVVDRPFAGLISGVQQCFQNSVAPVAVGTWWTPDAAVLNLVTGNAGLKMIALGLEAHGGTGVELHWVAFNGLIGFK